MVMSEQLCQIWFDSAAANGVVKHMRGSHDGTDGTDGPALAVGTT